MATQIELDELSRQLAPLDTDELVIAVVNSRIEHSTTPMLAIISFLRLIGSLSPLVQQHEDRKLIVATMCDLAEDLERPKAAMH